MDRPLQAYDEELRLFPDWKSQEVSVRSLRPFAASLVLHAIAISGLLLLPAGSVLDRSGPRTLAQLPEPFKLVEPPLELTQTEPNRGKPSKSVDLEALLPRPPLQLPPALPSTTRPAARVLAPPAPPTPEVAALPEPPKIDAAGSRLAQPSVQPPGSLTAPPPQIQTEEKPKLAFERPGSPAGELGSEGRQLARLAPPGGSVSEVGRELARGRSAGGLVVGDLGEGIGGLGEGLNLPPSPGRSGSSLELLSDPMGVDFRPYLIKVLSAVRRNWFAVMPESAKLGRRGRVVIQFAVSRDGSVPKLVIATPSGTDALDRAAVAGVSASNPFPPLPVEFRGGSVRLQFVFLYNLKSN